MPCMDELFVDNRALAGLQGIEIQKEVFDWVKKANAELGGLDVNDPKERAVAQRRLMGFFGDDVLVAQLLDVDKDMQMIRQQKIPLNRTVLTKVLAIGTRDYFSFELARARALA